MPKATFYTHVANPSAFIVRLVSKAVKEGNKILIWSDSSSLIEQIDRDLWQIDPESFLPHQQWSTHQPMPNDTPILLAYGDTLPRIKHDWMVLNLSPDFWGNTSNQPKRIFEIVSNNIEELNDARNRFKSYRQHGFEIEHHKMQDKA